MGKEKIKGEKKEKDLEEMETEEMDEYFAKRGTDLKAMIKRIKEMVERYSRGEGKEVTK